MCCSRYLRFMIFRSHHSIPGPGGMRCPTGRMISGGRGIAGPAGDGFAISVIVRFQRGRGASEPLDETISRRRFKYHCRASRTISFIVKGSCGNRNGLPTGNGGDADRFDTHTFGPPPDDRELSAWRRDWHRHAERRTSVQVPPLPDDRDAWRALPRATVLRLAGPDRTEPRHYQCSHEVDDSSHSSDRETPLLREAPSSDLRGQ
jgi:hypothetical protein